MCGPFLFMNARFLCLELWPLLARDLHRVVLRQFVFEMGSLEETTLGTQSQRKQEEIHTINRLNELTYYFAEWRLGEVGFPRHLKISIPNEPH